MRLNDPLITSFEFEGKEYEINLAFDVVLDVFDVINDDSFRDYEKAETALIILLGDQDYTPSIELWNHIYECFLNKDDEPVEYDRKGNPVPKPKSDENERFMDLEQDAPYIYASFIQAYGIDLYKEQGIMHWMQFKSLLDGLPYNTIFNRIIEIRRWKPSKGESAKYREDMRKAQKFYALRDQDED